MFIKALTVILGSLGSQLVAKASECDSYIITTDNAKILKNELVMDLGKLSEAELATTIQLFYSLHKNNLCYTKAPTLAGARNVRIVRRTYKELETNCNWGLSEATVQISQLEIVNSSSKIFLPSIEDFASEYIENSSLLKIEQDVSY